MGFNFSKSVFGWPPAARWPLVVNPLFLAAHLFCVFCDDRRKEERRKEMIEKITQINKENKTAEWKKSERKVSGVVMVMLVGATVD